MITSFIADSLFDGTALHVDRPISIQDGKIIAFDTVKGAKEVRLDGLLTAGFIDTQVNGGGAKLFNQSPELSTLTIMVRAHAQFGTTAMLPTLITDEVDKIERAANAVSQAIACNEPGIIGVHFEGPHISQAKRGIHHQDKIRPISDRELAQYCRNDIGIKMVTLAPENVDVDMIKTLVEHDVIVSLGHSDASYEQVNLALAAGASGFTHLFNAMSAFGSRSPNMVGAALLDTHSWCGIILDGHHVHPASAKLAYRAKAATKTLLVTDAMSTVGSPQDALHFDGHDITLVQDKLISNTGQLAGSALTMIAAVNNAITMLEVSSTEALKMASLYPADFLHTQRHGSIRIGSQADLILLKQDHTSAFQVNNTWIAGQKIF